MIIATNWSEPNNLGDINIVTVEISIFVPKYKEMKAQDKSALIKRLSIEVNRQSEIVRTQFQPLSKDRLLETSDNRYWSIVQNLEHLNLYYAYYNPAIKRSLDQARPDASASMFTSSWLGDYFTKSMDYRNAKKVKAFKDYIPPVDLNPEDVIRIFLSNQEELVRLLDRAKEHNLTKIKTAISLTKWITMRLGDVFQFVIMHNERHIVQAQSRIQAK